jgi:hypothetical protein
MKTDSPPNNLPALPSPEVRSAAESLPHHVAFDVFDPSELCDGGGTLFELGGPFDCPGCSACTLKAGEVAVLPLLEVVIP